MKSLFEKIEEYAEKISKKEKEKWEAGMSNQYLSYEDQHKQLKEFIHNRTKKGPNIKKEPPKILSSVPYGDIEDSKK